MNNENRGVGDRACWGLAARTITEKILCNPNTTLRRVQQRVRLSEESQTMNHDRGEQWWDSAGSGAPSLTAQLPLLDGAEGTSDGTVHRDKIRALEPNSPGKDVRDSLGFHAETPDAPPRASTRERGGGSRSPVLIGIGAVSHVSAVEACNNALAFTPRSLLGRTTPPRTATTSTTREAEDHNARHKLLQPEGLQPP
jgi:hypothetical protein